MKKTVYFTTGAIASVTVDVPDTVPAEDADEYAIEQAYEDLPHLCASCSGWGSFTPYSMDIGDWELDEHNPVVDD